MAAAECGVEVGLSASSKILDLQFAHSWVVLKSYHSTAHPHQPVSASSLQQQCYVGVASAHRRPRVKRIYYSCYS